MRLLLAALLSLAACAMAAVSAPLGQRFAIHDREKAKYTNELEELRQAGAQQVPPPPPLEDAVRAVVVSSGGMLGLRRLRSPVVLVAATGVAVWRVGAAAVGKRQLEAARSALEELLGARLKEQAPRGRAGVRTLAAELRARYALLKVQLRLEPSTASVAMPACTTPR